MGGARERDELVRRLRLSVWKRVIVGNSVTGAAIGVLLVMGGQVHIGTVEARRLTPEMAPIVLLSFGTMYAAAWLAARSLVTRSMAWFREGRRATPREVDMFVSLPRFVGAWNLAAWAFLATAHLTYAIHVAGFRLDAVAIVKTSLVYVYGYLIAGVLSYLLVESAFRPFLSALIQPDVTAWPRTLGLTARLLLSWGVVAGAPFVLLSLSFIGFTERQLILGGPALRVWSLVAAAVGLVVFVVIGRSIALPLERLRHALRQVAAGDLSAKVEVDEPAEIGQLEAGFNEMVGGLRDLSSHNEMLRSELRTQLEEVQASRVRIVEAADAERARIERNLHDGAQQRLLALSFALRTAQRNARDGADVENELGSAVVELDAAMSELRELARGIHPAILDEEGLGPALGSLAERAPVPTTVKAPLNGRLPGAVEVTAYFVVAESLANIAKYAGASTVTIEAVLDDGTLRIEIADDGAGGAEPGKGSGLRGLADRVAALGGELTIVSPAGRGTRVAASIPCS